MVQNVLLDEGWCLVIMRSPMRRSLLSMYLLISFTRMNMSLEVVLEGVLTFAFIKSLCLGLWQMKQFVNWRLVYDLWLWLLMLQLLHGNERTLGLDIYLAH